MRSYLVLRLNHRESRQRLVNKIVCSPKQLLNKLNALTDSHGEYAYKTIREVIDSYTDDDSSMTIVDLATLDFVSTFQLDLATISTEIVAIFLNPKYLGAFPIPNRYESPQS